MSPKSKSKPTKKRKPRKHKQSKLPLIFNLKPLRKSFIPPSEESGTLSTVAGERKGPGVSLGSCYGYGEESVAQSKEQTTETQDSSAPTEVLETTVLSLDEFYSSLDTERHEEPDLLNEAELREKKAQLLHQYWQFVRENLHDFNGWTYLIQHVELTEDLNSLREVYNTFLPLFPYCYGYWKRYAEFEKRYDFKERALAILERGLEAIPLCCDLWIAYLKLYCEVHREKDNLQELVRREYERALQSAGCEFQCDLLWEAYIKWESDYNQLQAVTSLYRRIIQVPTKLYNRHWDNFVSHVRTHHPRDILDQEEYDDLRKATCKRLGMRYREEPMLEPGEISRVAHPEDRLTSNMKESIVAKAIPIHEACEIQVEKRWKYEERIKRPYFHVKPLDRKQLKNWEEYLQYEMKEGQHGRTLLLFERCLIACAHYEEFWCKYTTYLETYLRENYKENAVLVEKIIENKESDSKKNNELSNSRLKVVENLKDKPEINENEKEVTENAIRENVKDDGNEQKLEIHLENKDVELRTVSDNKQSVENKDLKQDDKQDVTKEECYSITVEIHDKKALTMFSKKIKDFKRIKSQNSHSVLEEDEGFQENKEMEENNQEVVEGTIQKQGSNNENEIETFKDSNKEETNIEKEETTKGRCKDIETDEDINKEGENGKELSVSQDDVSFESTVTMETNEFEMHKENNLSGSPENHAGPNFENYCDVNSDTTVTQSEIRQEPKLYSEMKNAQSIQVNEDVKFSESVVDAVSVCSEYSANTDNSVTLGSNSRVELVSKDSVLKKFAPFSPAINSFLQITDKIERKTEPGWVETVRNVYKRACIIHCPHKPTVRLQWAAYEEQLGNTTESFELLYQVLSQYPNLLEACYQLINMHRRLGNVDMVKQLYEKYLQYFTDQSEKSWIAINYARFLYKGLGESDKALTVIRSSLKIDRSNAALYSHIVDICYQRHPLDVRGVVAALELAIRSKDLPTKEKIKFAKKKLNFLKEFGDITKYRESILHVEKYQHLLKEEEIAEAKRKREEEKREKERLEQLRKVEEERKKKEEEELKKHQETVQMATMLRLTNIPGITPVSAPGLAPLSETPYPLMESSYHSVAPTWDLYYNNYGQSNNIDVEDYEQYKQKEYNRLIAQGYPKDQQGNQIMPLDILRPPTKRPASGTNNGACNDTANKRLLLNAPTAGTPILNLPVVRPPACVNIPEWFIREGGELCMGQTENGKSLLHYWPHFMSDNGYMHMFGLLRHALKWHIVTVMKNGKWIPCSRLVSWLGPCDFTFQGATMTRNTNWPPELLDLIHRLIDITGYQLNCCFIDRYRNGHDWQDWHSEDHPALGRCPPIIAVSLGAIRMIELQRKGSPHFLRFPLFPGSLFMMEGAFQEDWVYEIPKDPTITNESMIMTFRIIHALS